MMKEHSDGLRPVLFRPVRESFIQQLKARWCSRSAPDAQHKTVSSDPELLLQIRHLRQSWPEQPDDLFYIEKLHWRRQERIWLQGANGTGKSTLMRLISGLEPLVEGQVLVAAGPKPKRICYLHQTPYLFAGSVEQNLNFVIRSLKGEARAAAARALGLGLQLADLEGLRHQQAVTLSGGERQRLALLRAWLLQPDILLLDEPAANLDDYSVRLMHRLVEDLIAKGGAIMVSSHQQNALTELCNCRWLIEKGGVRADFLSDIKK